jgi:4-amino-4-deoxy-L-arabinose transferase-like glycosyltransferase
MPAALLSASPPQRGSAPPVGRARWRTAIVGLFLLACVVRVGFVLAALRTNYNPYVRIQEAGDMAAYASIAVSLVKGDGFSEHYGPVIADFFQDPRHVQPPGPPVPSARKSVGYPLFLALLFKLFGFRLVPVLIVQALLSALSTLLVYRLARQVGSPGFAMIPYALSVVYYPFWFKAALLLSETLLIFSMLLALYGMVRWLIRPTVRRAWWAGVGLGASYLVKAVLLPFLPFYLVAAYRHHRRLGLQRAFVVGAATLVGALAIALAPVVIRNYLRSGRLLITPSHSGYQLIQIHNPYNPTFESYNMPGFGNEAYEGLRRAMAEARPTLPPGTRPVLAEILIDDAYRRAALAFIAADPVHFLKSLQRSFWNVWRMDYPSAKPYRLASNLVCYAMLVPFCFWGMAIAVARRNVPALFLAGFLIYVAAFHSIMASQLRYRITAMPAFFILASLGLARGWAWIEGRRRRGGMAGSAGA